MGANSDLVCPVISTENEEDFRVVIRHAIADGGGANIVFALGRTGEFYVLPMKDKKTLMSIAVDEVHKQKERLKQKNELVLPSVAVGITGDNLDETIKLAQYAEEINADYAVLMPGYITKKADGNYTRGGITGNIETILDEADEIKLILYTHSEMTGGKNMRTATWKKLARHPRIVALKASACNAKRVKNYREAANGHAKVYFGEEIEGLWDTSDGIVAGGSNVLPVAWAIATRRGLDDDIIGWTVAQRLNEFQGDYAKNPIGAFKYLLTRLGVISKEKTFDRELELSAGLRSCLDKLMLNRSFKELYGLGNV